MPRKMLGMSGAYSGLSGVAGISGSGGEEEVPDLIPPSATTNLVANPTATPSAQLSWDAATDNVSVSGYIVERRVKEMLDMAVFQPDSYGGHVALAKPPGAIATTTSTNGIDFGPVTDTQCYAVQCVGAISGSGTPTLISKLRESDDNATWSDIAGATFTNVTAANNIQEITFVRTKRYVRWVGSLSGVTPSFNVSVQLGKEPEEFVELVDDVTDLEYEDTDVTEGYTYEYRVNAKDPTNNRGDYTDVEPVFIAAMDIELLWNSGSQAGDLGSASFIVPWFDGILTQSHILQRRTGTGSWADTQVLVNTDAAGGLDLNVDDSPVSYPSPETALFPENNYQWRLVPVDSNDVRGVPFGLVSRVPQLFTAEGTAVLTKPAEAVALMTVAHGRGQSGTGSHGGNSGQFSITFLDTFDNDQTYLIDSTHVEFSDVSNGVHTSAYHGAESDAGSPIGNYSAAGQNNGASNGTIGGGGAAGINYNTNYDSPTDGDSGGTGGQSYEWPGGNGGDGGDPSGQPGTNYGSGGGGPDGTPGSALACLLWFVDGDYPS